MLEKVADRRNTNVEEEQKVVAGLGISNALTSVAKCSAGGLLIRSKRHKTDFSSQTKNCSEETIQMKDSTKIFT